MPLRYSPAMATTTMGCVISDSSCRASGWTTSPFPFLFLIRQMGSGIWISDAIAHSRAVCWGDGLVSKAGAPCPRDIVTRLHFSKPSRKDALASSLRTSSFYPLQAEASGIS